MRGLTIICLGLFVFASGCGSDAGKLPGVPDGASEAITETRDMLLDSSIMAVKLAKMEDLVSYESRFPKAVGAVKDKSITIVWGKGFREGITADKAEIIAFESKAATEGGWVVKDNGELYNLSAADFSAKAPKASTKK